MNYLKHIGLICTHVYQKQVSMVWAIPGQFGENPDSLKYLKKTKIVENSDKKTNMGLKAI